MIMVPGPGWSLGAQIPSEAGTTRNQTSPGSNGTIGLGHLDGPSGSISLVSVFTGDQVICSPGEMRKLEDTVNLILCFDGTQVEEISIQLGTNMVDAYGWHTRRQQMPTRRLWPLDQVGTFGI